MHQYIKVQRSDHMKSQKKSKDNQLGFRTQMLFGTVVTMCGILVKLAKELGVLLPLGKEDSAVHMKLP